MARYISSGIWLLLCGVTMTLFFYYLKREKSLTAYAQFREYYQEGRYNAADSCLDLAIQLNHKNALFYAYKGLVSIRMMEVERDSLFSLDSTSLAVRDAIRFYKQALSMASWDDHILHNLSWIYFYCFDYDKALTLINRAIALRPGIALYRVSKGIFFDGRNELDSAVHSYVAAVRLSPEILDSRFFVSLSNRFSDNINNELKSLAGTLSEESSPILRAKLGKILFYSNRLVEAENELYKVSKMLPNLNRVWLNLAQVRMAMRDTLNYSQHLHYSYLLDKSDYLPCVLLAQYHMDRGNYETAIYFNGRGIQNWLNRRYEYAFRAKRYYGVQPIANDIIPRSLLYEISSPINTEAIVDQLSEASRIVQHEQLRAICDSITNDHLPLERLSDFNFTSFRR